MTSIDDLVAAAGGLLHKRALVAHGATDRHLTAAVRGGGVSRPRRGWYSTWPPTDPRHVAVAVGGRLTGASALAQRGAWSWREPGLVVSVPRTASRLRRRRGVRVVWDGPEVSERGGVWSVDVRDALARAVVEAASFEDAVVLADWARASGVVHDDDDARAVLGRHRRDAATLAEWADGGCDSIIESAAGTRLRLAGRRIRRQVVVGPRGERVDMVVDGVVGLETDGRQFHADRFERDRRKDALVAIHGLAPFRASYLAVRDRWEETESAVDALVRTRRRGVRTARGTDPTPRRPRGRRGARSWHFGPRRRPRSRLGVGGNAGASRRLLPTVTASTPVPVPSATPDAVKIDVWSDIACPWCFIGKRKFEAAAAQFDGAVEVEYHSFELAPETPVDFDGDEVDFLSGHKGLQADQVAGMLASVAEIAARVGLDYDFGALRHTNTVKAHELLHHAKSLGRQLEMTERLFAAYFEEGRHVGRVDDLADLAAEIGLDRDDALGALESGRHLAAVRDDQARAQSLGITGVPFFVLDGKYGISGAQAPEAFLQALEQVAAERATATESAR
ncbi:putative DsbA family dithiol-disulfide isomerase [Frigoribacterium sp. PhB160]|nr:putative DsbA family dithiol-disulfide isomerase [Frigoribacterium sp. PhB160]